MAKYSFLNVAEDVLKISNSPMEPRDIWQMATTHQLDKKLNSEGKTPWISIGARLYMDTKENVNSLFIRTSKSPTLFGLKGKHNESDFNNIAITTLTKDNKVRIKERNLHPLLAYFARFNLEGVHVKTIYHERSTKKNFNEWLHPDLVGIRFPDFKDLKENTLWLAGEVKQPLFQLLSFELKTKLDFGNLRESFFQAVSNSSWANQSYLVAESIKESADFLTELKRLSSSFGVGIIKLDANSPDDSEILYPAKDKEVLDWETINKLLTENPDFEHFITSIRAVLRSKRIYNSDYDVVEEDVDKLKAIVFNQ